MSVMVPWLLSCVKIDTPGRTFPSLSVTRPFRGVWAIAFLGIVVMTIVLPFMEYCSPVPVRSVFITLSISASCRDTDTLTPFNREAL